MPLRSSTGATGTATALSAATSSSRLRRAIASALTNDPTFHCDPLGLTRLLFFAPAPMEIIQTPNRMIQNFEWTWDYREVWMDGRKLPDVDDYIPRYNGYSTEPLINITHPKTLFTNERCPIRH